MLFMRLHEWDLAYEIHAAEEEGNKSQRENGVAAEEFRTTAHDTILLVWPPVRVPSASIQHGYGRHKR